MKKNLLSAFVIAGCIMLSAAICAAQEVDPIDVIRRSGTPEMTLDRARGLLIEGGERNIDRIVSVLTEGGVNVTEHARLNFSIVLGEIARNVDNPRMRQGLLLCTNDTNPGVRYWGLLGLSRIGNLPQSDLAAVIERFMERNQPRYLRIQAAEIASEKRIESVVPAMFEMLRRNIPPFETIRNKAVEDMLGDRLRPATTPDMMPYDMPDMMMYDAYDVPDYEMMRGGPMPMAFDPRSRVLRPAEVAPEEEALTSAEAKEAIRDNQSRFDVLQTMADELEKKAEISEIRRIGRALETLTAGKRGEIEAWGFTTKPPWELDEIAQASLGWFDANKQLYQAP